MRFHSSKYFDHIPNFHPIAVGPKFVAVVLFVLVDGGADGTGNGAVHFGVDVADAVVVVVVVGVGVVVVVGAVDVVFVDVVEVVFVVGVVDGADVVGVVDDGDVDDVALGDAADVSRVCPEQVACCH